MMGTANRLIPGRLRGEYKAMRIKQCLLSLLLVSLFSALFAACAPAGNAAGQPQSPEPAVTEDGSGTPDDQIQEAIRHGICKLNIYADNRIAMWNGFKTVVAETSRPDPPPVEYFARVRAVMAQTVRQKIELCLSKDRC